MQVLKFIRNEAHLYFIGGCHPYLLLNTSTHALITCLWCEKIAIYLLRTIAALMLKVWVVTSEQRSMLKAKSCWGSVWRQKAVGDKLYF